KSFRAPRHSTSKARRTILPQIAKQLGVAHILEGSVQKASDQVRVNVQLINALTDAHLWAETFDRKLTDIFAVESEIAKTVAETLQARLTGSEKHAIAKTPIVNPEAYELYLKGKFFAEKRTGADLRKSIEYYDQAIARILTILCLCRLGQFSSASFCLRRSFSKRGSFSGESCSQKS